MRRRWICTITNSLRCIAFCWLRINFVLSMFQIPCYLHICYTVWGMRVEKRSSMAFVFKYFRQFKEKRRPGTFAILAPRLYNRYNHAHVPGPHMLQSPGPGPCSKCSKTVEVRCSYSELKPCQREIATDEIQGKKIIESAAI